MTTPVNYDAIAPHYHQRYAVNAMPGIAAWLRGLVPGAGRVLEVGCGTGRWLAELAAAGPRLFGLDFSAGMLRQAQSLLPGPLPATLAQGTAGALPYAGHSFDLVYAVNALHHFPDQPGFVREARRLLRPGGALAVAGLDPHSGRDRWYLYDYFPGTLAADQARFPSAGALVNWLVAAGFERAAWHVPERIQSRVVGRALLADHFVQPHGTSQLALLSAADYEAGLDRLRAAIAAAEAAGSEAVFEADLAMSAVIGFVPE